MRRLLSFFTEMDARAIRAVLVTAALIAATAGLLLLGRTEQGAAAVAGLERWLEGFAGSGLGLPATVLVFTVAAYVGAPQFLLIAAAVVAFGPWAGFAYSWVATVASAAVTFWTGRLVGARTLERFGGETLNAMSRRLGENAFVGSMVIRNVPSAPFIVVNMAFGASSARFGSFIAGCAVGVLPKLVVVALLGTSVRTAAIGDGVWSSAIAAGLAAAWIAAMLGARAWLRRRAARKVLAEER
jgi:uncharacterized membrane protein YdjX (TVP38/TMEM64 family)